MRRGLDLDPTIGVEIQGVVEDIYRTPLLSSTAWASSSRPPPASPHFSHCPV
jgi:hypothetical protein